MLTTLLGTRRKVLAWVFAICVLLLAFALYLQHVVGLEPCPMSVSYTHLTLPTIYSV